MIIHLKFPVAVVMFSSLSTVFYLSVEDRESGLLRPSRDPRGDVVVVVRVFLVIFFEVHQNRKK